MKEWLLSLWASLRARRKAMSDERFRFGVLTGTNIISKGLDPIALMDHNMVSDDPDFRAGMFEAVRKYEGFKSCSTLSETTSKSNSV